MRRGRASGLAGGALAGKGTILPEPPDAVRRAGDALFALALELGGTVTGEHGIGLLKRDWLAREAAPDVTGINSAIKKAFDPHGILNPGKGF